MTLLSLRDVVHGYEDRLLLRGVSLTVGDEERIGLVGPNGSGKSTLLAILAGALAPDAGERTVRRDLAIGWLEQEPRVEPDARVRDVVRGGRPAREEALRELGRVHASLEAERDPDLERRLLARQAQLEERVASLGGHDVEHEVEALVEGLGLTDPDARCGSISGGEARRVALARLLFGGPDLLLLDEPTNHLDAFVTDWLEDRLVAARTPLVLVTHDRYFLDRVCTRIVELDRGDLVSYEGGYGDYLIARADRLETERKEERSRQNLLRRETAWMRRGAPARTTKARARIARYAALVDAEPEPLPDELALALPAGARLGNRVIDARGVSKSFGGRTLIAGLDLSIGPGERLGIVGPNGAGKTTLLRLLTREIEPDQGEVVHGETVVVASIDQRRSDLDPTKTVIEEVAGRGDQVRVGDRAIRAEAFLEQFLFAGAQKHARVATLSGGEKNRLLLAKLLCAGGNVLVLDEPTNDLDLATLRTLEEALLAFPGTVLVVSHDRWFLDRVATRVLALDGSGTARIHPGDVSQLIASMRADRERASAGARAAATPAPRPEATPKPAAKRKTLAPWEQKEYDALLERIGAEEQGLAALDARLADPTLWAGPRAEAERVRAERAAQAQRVAALHERWEELEAKR